MYILIKSNWLIEYIWWKKYEILDWMYKWSSQEWKIFEVDYIQYQMYNKILYEWYKGSRNKGMRFDTILIEKHERSKSRFMIIQYILWRFYHTNQERALDQVPLLLYSCIRHGNRRTIYEATITMFVWTQSRNRFEWTYPRTTRQRNIKVISPSHPSLRLWTSVFVNQIFPWYHGFQL